MSKILVVEDEAGTRKALARLVSKYCSEVIQAENGQEGWDALNTHKEINCILVDMLMPVMDGREFVNRLRQDEHFCDLFVIIVSGVFSFEEVEGLLLLAPEKTFFLKKPVDPPALRKYLEKVNMQERLLSHPERTE